MPAGRNAVSLRDIAHFAEAIPALVLATVAVKLPFRVLTRLMSTRRERPKSDRRQAVSIVKAVERASRRLPWRTVCFQQGLAAHWMLRLRGIPSILHYGIRTGDGAVSAHVWISLDGEILIGKEEAGRYSQVATFPSQAS